ncbi:chemotaxis protein CheW [Desulfuromonas versatilis]|uniref:Chemotaxis protein CheW n=2 Tax=Desulfuromonas versatilis TaxID=2802975 RepID=A0ABN6DZZ1_9BACT|nr:chemotaxis protein CheW [Desulfuromonas versatilis]
MDLADIRKKAKADQKGATEAEPSVGRGSGRPAASIQGEPLEFDLEAMETPAPEPAGTATATVDPLEALFSGCGSLELATEEQYLKGLSQSENQQEQKRQWLTFELGKEVYALDIVAIHEIIKPREITDIPRVPEFILGIISLRGIIVPVYDLKRRLKLGTAEITPASRIIVCQNDDRTAGLLVDCINQVVGIAEDGIEPPPSVLTGHERELIAGVGRQDGRMMILLNLQNVLDPELI